MILAGVAAHLGYLSLDWIIVCGFSGTFFRDQLYFFLGRRHGKRMLSNRPPGRHPPIGYLKNLNVIRYCLS